MKKKKNQYVQVEKLKLKKLGMASNGYPYHIYVDTRFRMVPHPSIDPDDTIMLVKKKNKTIVAYKILNYKTAWKQQE